MSPSLRNNKNENTAVSRISSWRFEQGGQPLSFSEDLAELPQCPAAALPSYIDCACVVSWSFSMANSRFQYVKKFELSDALLPDTYLVARLDGHRFTNFTAQHGFTKPNDERGLLLMAECARQVMSEWPDLAMAFGQSDEFSFLLPASSPLYGRRSAKLSTSFVSLFSSSFVFFWPKHFPDTPLLYPPNFDARVVAYPTAQHVRDYFGWRQADCHINNLYNTCFWALVADGVPKQDAQVALKGTTSGDKNELLFSRFGINYNDTPRRFRKGTTLYRARPAAVAAPEEPPRSLLHGASEGGDGEDAPTDGCAAVGDADDARGGGAPKGWTNENKPVVVASANEKNKPVVASANDENSAVASANEEKAVVSSANKEKPVVSSANEKTPVVASANEAKKPVVTSANEKAKNNPVTVASSPETALSSCRVGSTPEPSADGVENAVGKAGTPDRVPLTGERQNAIEKAKPPADEIVRVVTSGSGAVKLKRLLKKGHAPPGTIEEDACDLIRTDFWDRNPHILSGIARR